MSLIEVNAFQQLVIEEREIMITVTVLTIYVLGIAFAPGPTRAVLKAIRALIGTVVVALVIFWRIFPNSVGTHRWL